MAQKFGNSRWVKEGFLDNHKPGLVIGQMTFAALGNVDFCLQGDLRGEIEGQGIRFHNPQFIDDERAADSLFDFCIPQVGKVSLMSFDPHPLLPAHPYLEWFSMENQHYRIELQPGDAWIMTIEELDAVRDISLRIHNELVPQL
ncbi:MAG: hypothetical protein KC563_04365 [Nitrospira sp.]|nr:hypothetical protein [Nitrospira sp.]MCB9712181.1 hypothetical protein [Nitrospiraceae bacterium]MDR4488054.1 hypothetical protein [Nitrospirales bacterium]MCA9465432.1 hypothetical protein [Nitrospira sp.]MCA9475030.1 hypothetical protein [Nitrospira sp.]